MVKRQRDFGGNSVITLPFGISTFKPPSQDHGPLVAIQGQIYSARASFAFLPLEVLPNSLEQAVEKGAAVYLSVTAHTASLLFLQPTGENRVAPALLPPAPRDRT